MGKLFTFGRSVAVHWGALVTGGCFIGALGVYQNVGNNVPHWVYWIIAIIAAFISFFRAWLDEHNQSRSLGSEVETLKKEAEAIRDSAKPSIANASPVQTVSPNITVSPLIQTHIAPVGPQLHPSAPEKPQPKHNMRHVGTRSIIGAGNNKLLVACFENVPIPGERVADFDFAQVRIEYYRQGSHDFIGAVFPASWSETDEPHIDFPSGPTHSVILAAYIEEWKALELKEQKTYWGSVYTQEQFDLPYADVIASVTVIGESNVSLAPVKIGLRLGKDGSFKITPL